MAYINLTWRKTFSHGVHPSVALAHNCASIVSVIYLPKKLSFFGHPISRK